MGTLTVLFVFLIGKALGDAYVGLLASTLLTFNSLHITHAHIAIADLPMTFFSTVSMYALIIYLKDKRPCTWCAIASCMAALAVASKYSAGIFTIIIGCTICIHRLKDSYRKLLQESIVSILAFLAAGFICAPYLFLEYDKVLQGLKIASRSTHLGADSLNFIEHVWFYCTTVFQSIPIALGLFIPIGLYACIRLYKASCIPILFGIFFWIGISTLKLHWIRWSLPIHITASILIAIGILYTIRNYSIKNNIFTTLILLFLALSFSQLLGNGTVTALSFLHEDTRDKAQQTLQEIGVTTRNSIWEGYTPFKKNKRKSAFTDLDSLSPTINYIVLSSRMYDRYLDEPNRYTQQNKWYQTVFTWPIVFTYSPGCPGEVRNFHIYNALLALNFNKTCLRGPTIQVYSVPDRNTVD